MLRRKFPHHQQIPYKSSTLVTCLVRLRWWRSVSKVVSTHPRGQPFSTGCFQKSFHSWVWGLHGVCDIGVCPVCWLMNASFIGRTNRFFNQGHDDILRLHTFPPTKMGSTQEKAWFSYIKGYRGTNYFKPSSLGRVWILQEEHPQWCWFNLWIILKLVDVLSPQMEAYQTKIDIYGAYRFQP